MTREEGVRQIYKAQWEPDDAKCLNLHLDNPDGMPVSRLALDASGLLRPGAYPAQHRQAAGTGLGR
jgi:hypothetical protein